ncbi:hypothetical protein PYW07_015361 [Mythimna separata]|uniref:Uncharacterized protein n=1 Tax=Mythimna separata TaxID=271217 RepID=A0AAD7YZW0_MYTSE|nr:hypothetical protein PYW07_015361 [Mythimna separata]
MHVAQQNFPNAVPVQYNCAQCQANRDIYQYFGRLNRGRSSGKDIKEIKDLKEFKDLKEIKSLSELEDLLKNQIKPLKESIRINEEELKKTVRKEEELRRQEEVSRAAAAAKARRQEAEREERERRRQESELAAMRERHLRERVAHISQTAHGQKMLLERTYAYTERISTDNVPAVSVIYSKLFVKFKLSSLFLKKIATMTSRIFLLLAAVVVLEGTCAAPANDASVTGKSVADSQALNDDKDDLKTAASSGYGGDRYSDWGRYPSAQGVTGYGSIDSRYNYGGYGGYDSPYGYNGYDSDPRYGAGYAGNSGYGGYAGSAGYGAGYAGNSGYGSYGVNPGYSGYKGGYGGYGGYGGSGGLNSYYGYNNPLYQGANHLGNGYYNRRPGYGGSIYNSGITPSLVTGYRGYSKK